MDERDMIKVLEREIWLKYWRERKYERKKESEFVREKEIMIEREWVRKSVELFLGLTVFVWERERQKVCERGSVSREKYR